MKVAQPDLILVQMSPEFLLNDLELQPEKFNYDTNEWKYSSQKYVDQLIRPGFELYPSLKSKLKIAKLLRQYFCIQKVSGLSPGMVIFFS